MTFPRSLLAASVLIAANCSSPVRRPQSGATGEENPFRDPKETASRDELVARFFAARGIEFSAAAESEWVALGGEAAVIATIRNSGPKPVTFVGERSTGIWPFDTTEKAHAAMHVVTTFASMRAGVQQIQDALPVDALPTLEIPPGEERSFRLPLAPALPDEAVCARVAARPVVHPLAIVVGDEPERVITLKFGEVVVWFAPPEIAAARGDDDAPLEQALAERPQLVVAAAVRSGERDPVGTIDRLLLALPGPDALARRARCVALEWLTGAGLGDSVERWRGWWDSEEGQRFARERRKLP